MPACVLKIAGDLMARDRPMHLVALHQSERAAAAADLTRRGARWASVDLGGGVVAVLADLPPAGVTPQRFASSAEALGMLMAVMGHALGGRMKAHAEWSDGAAADAAALPTLAASAMAARLLRGRST